MFKIVVAILLTIALAAQAQVDKSFCDIEKIPHDPKALPVPVGNVNAVFQSDIETNVDGMTEETQEYYDGVNNVGVSATLMNSVRTITYCYFNTNEMISIVHFPDEQAPRCQVMDLDKSYGLSPFFIIKVDGKDHIATPLAFLSAVSDNVFVYTGEATVRGMPVNQWVTCAYDLTSNTTSKYTFSYMNREKWGADTLVPEGGSVPVQILREKKLFGQEGNANETSVISYTEFKYGLENVNKDAFATPPGIYCDGRKNTKEIPRISERFAFTLQVVSAFPGLQNRAGTITYMREEYEFDKNIFRLTSNVNQSQVVELHDFNTGLNYQINKYLGLCRVDKLTGTSVDATLDGNYVVMRNSTQFFDFDNANVQYVGQRVIDNTNTDVWVGKRMFQNQMCVFEWHFLADGWENKEQIFATINDLLLLTINFEFKAPTGEITRVPINYYFNDWASWADLMDFDISECNREIKKTDFYVHIGASVGDVAFMRGHDRRFRHSILNTLRDTMGINTLRISQIEPIYVEESSEIIVMFTLYEMPKETGPVQITKPDIPLKDAVDIMNKKLKSEDINVQFKDDFGNTYTYKIESSQLHEFDRTSGGFVTFIKQIRGNPDGYSGVEIFFFIFGFVLLGIIIGAIAGFFLIVKRSNQKFNRLVDTRLSFINPNFDSPSKMDIQSFSNKSAA